MKHKTIMLASAAGIALVGSAALAPMAMADPIPAARSYADLLEPVPDAMARLHADDEMQSEARMIPAGLNIGIGVNMHHHHHHHHHSARWFRSHGYFWNGQVWVMGPPPPPPYWHNHHADWYRGQGYHWDGRVWIEPQRYHHHHHHHHWR
jgi:hypothetical protein